MEALSGNEEAVAVAAAAAAAAAAAHKDGGKNPFKRLRTKWTLEDAPAPPSRTRSGDAEQRREWTKVDLDMSMRLEDPFLQMMLSKVADETATKMIDAFEKRVREQFAEGM